MATLGNLVDRIAKSIGIENEDSIKQFLSNVEVTKVEVPDEVYKGVGSKLFSVESARNSDELKDPVWNTLNELQINKPKSQRTTSVPKDEKHPEGEMTDDEFVKFDEARTAAIKTDLQDIHKIKAGTIAYQVSDGGYELGDGEYSYVEKNDIVNDIDWIRIDFSDVIETWYKGDLQKLYG